MIGLRGGGAGLLLARHPIKAAEKRIRGAYLMPGGFWLVAVISWTQGSPPPSPTHPRPPPLQTQVHLVGHGAC